MNESIPRYCEICKRDFLYGDKLYYQDRKCICENCIVDYLRDMCIDNTDYVAEELGFEIWNNYDPRDDT